MESINQAINCLTSDEDLRQELWVYHLTGNPTESFSAHLDQLKIQKETEDLFSESLWNLFKNPPTEDTLELLTNFSDYERSIISLLMLGLTASQIGAVKGISEVRIKQAITTIRYNKVWSKYGTKEKLIR